MDRLADFRRVFSQVVTASVGPDASRITEAFAKVPRHTFVGEGPWVIDEDGRTTETNDPAVVYHDFAMGLAPERGITTGLPSLHARCLGALGVKQQDDIIHVGAGSGYYTAILAELAPEGRVFAYEIDEQLAALAKKNLEHLPNVVLQAASASDSELELPMADVVYVNAGVQELPLAWLGSLRVGGRLMLPLVPAGGMGGMFLVTRLGESSFSARFLEQCRFVPCVGTLRDELQHSLSQAFRNDPLDVKSLCLGNVHGEECWFGGTGWWLSKRPPS